MSDLVYEGPVTCSLVVVAVSVGGEAEMKWRFWQQCKQYKQCKQAVQAVTN